MSSNYVKHDVCVCTCEKKKFLNINIILRKFIARRITENMKTQNTLLYDFLKYSSRIPTTLSGVTTTLTMPFAYRNCKLQLFFV